MKESKRGGAVPCPHCGHGFSRILYTARTRRRRECSKCHGRFLTHEKVSSQKYQFQKKGNVDD